MSIIKSAIVIPVMLIALLFSIVMYATIAMVGFVMATFLDLVAGPPGPKFPPPNGRC